MNTTHDLKIDSGYFDLVIAGKKNWEIRKNDRNYCTNDILRLREFDRSSSNYTGNEVAVKVLYILDSFPDGLSYNYVIMSTEVVNVFL